MSDNTNENRVDTDLRQQRREEVDKKWRESPVERYLESREKEVGTNKYKDEKRTLDLFREHLRKNVEVDGTTVRDVTEEDVESFITDILDPDPDKSDVRIERILAYLQRFYGRLKENRAILDNPVIKPLEDFRDDDERQLGSPDRPYLPFENMKRYVSWLSRPFSRSFILHGLKHGTRSGEVINIDLRCLHLDHPIFYQIIEKFDIRLDPRVRDKPDSMVIYEQFNEGDEIPNEDTPGSETNGEVRAQGNKRSEEGGSILPVDSEFKTALIEWLLVRPPTYGANIHPLYPAGVMETDRIRFETVAGRLWQKDKVDSISRYGEENALENCPECGASVEAENLANSGKTGRRYHCFQCGETHWRPIMWDSGLKTAQKVTYHQFRHYFSDAHRVGKSKIHDGDMPEKVRKKRIRGDYEKGEDTDEAVYSDKQYEDWESDVREPYLDSIYKFDIYDTVIPAVGEGWDD